MDKVYAKTAAQKDTLSQSSPSFSPVYITATNLPIRSFWFCAMHSAIQVICEVLAQHVVTQAEQNYIANFLFFEFQPGIQYRIVELL